MWELIKDIIAALAKFFLAGGEPPANQPTRPSQEVQDEIVEETGHQVEAVDDQSDSERLDTVIDLGLVRPDGPGGPGGDPDGGPGGLRTPDSD